ncbi:hypothetical protein SAMN05421734_101349 [Pelagirhabdus alkalitolerans]|uniref:Uncharacterized protein n=1 Tax=Pelagirhabdus alkalitolerans TaxID=1612202 RepID=A0A1G6GRG8_9BACI|nr:hypothetical protein [Pelagirhabdus alkalitolerans]SDB83786.1 hypothetical protein SAMN05421734_101349 [Pelagirhabdus alkalitolerans]
MNKCFGTLTSSVITAMVLTVILLFITDNVLVHRIGTFLIIFVSVLLFSHQKKQ